MKRRIILKAAQATVAVLTAMALLASSSQPISPAETTIATAPQGNWQPSFVDEFNGAAGSKPNPQVWFPDVGGTGWGNRELQYYTRGENTYVDGQGHLVIEARAESGGYTCWYGPCTYTSGKVVTKQSRNVTFAQTYGRFEARIKMPPGTGLWPAFWLLGDNIDVVGHPESGEIDVVEVLGRNTREVEQHAHGPYLEFGSEFTLPEGQSVTDWHTYAVQWSSDAIEWQVDGATTRTLTREDAGSRWVFDHPFYILLNLAVGGNWPGAPNADTVFPAQMLVDYVRVYSETAP
jgi:beta-glucanase (GH16 family)